MTKRFGFTLAEVLITLGIIGVVAAMTIPTLMNSTGQQEFKTGFKKIVSTLNQAVTMNVALIGDDFSTLVNTTATTDPNAASPYAMFSSRMDVISTGTGGITNFAAGNYTLFFSDGMALSFDPNTKACTASNRCPAVVDVNGSRKPNTLTNSTAIKDQFPVIFIDQQVLPNSTTARSVLYGGA